MGNTPEGGNKLDNHPSRESDTLKGRLFRSVCFFRKYNYAFLVGFIITVTAMVPIKEEPLWHFRYFECLGLLKIKF